ncbi:hypothetical protein ACOBQB_12035 [Streptomyces sp. G5(2025)]|uniref:MmyB family transcriptional regulator n=1 Tax=Streptomyces sp. G5(2025) TaxID=3406628 RepID=UPI003C18CEBC
MAYVTDASWELLAHNEPFQAMFPDRQVPTNTMRWMLLDRVGREQLTDWRDSWAPMVLPQLRAALVARPDDEILRGIEKEVLADPELAHLYDIDGALIHPDGHERPLRHAVHGLGWVSICAAQPMTAPGSRLFILIYHPGTARKHARAPMLRAV